MKFQAAVMEAAKACDVWIEVGPGQILSRLLADCLPMRSIALDASGPSLRGLLPKFDRVQFNRPVVVPADNSLKIQIAALVRPCGRIDVVLRSEQTGFAVDHFQASLSPSEPEGIAVTDWQNGEKLASIEPERDIYGGLLFHTGRFRCLQAYQQLRAKSCVAEITPSTGSWFSRYFPSQLILGDPGMRDAVIHALQACVPHATILPTAIERLTIYAANFSDNQFVSARERQWIGDRFLYDLSVFDRGGNLLETWQGLELRVIKAKNPRSNWIPALLPPYLERQIQSVVPSADVTLILDRDGTVARRVRSDRALQFLTAGKFDRRPDGKPERLDGKPVSVAHAGDLTLVGTGCQGCDLEGVTARTEAAWRDLLGLSRWEVAHSIAVETGESLDLTATRLWSAGECLKKAGNLLNTPVILQEFDPDGWVWLKAGESSIGTFLVSLQEVESPFVLAILLSPEEIPRPLDRFVLKSFN